MADDRYFTVWLKTTNAASGIRPHGQSFVFAIKIQLSGPSHWLQDLPTIVHIGNEVDAHTVTSATRNNR